MKLNNFWTDDYPLPGNIPAADALPEQVDFAVVGSGCTGLMAARALAKHGASVAVLERETIGWGASSRNGGMTSPGVKKDIKKVMADYGRETGKRIWQASIDAVNLVRDVIATEQIDCDWDARGMLGVASKPSHFEAMQRKAEWFKENLDFDVDIVNPADLRTEIGSDAYFGGVIDHMGAGLQPAKYTAGLAAAAARAGASLVENAGVSAVSRNGSGYMLDTSRGRLQAADIIMATNGYTDLLVRGLKPKILPVGSYIIVTEPLPPDLQQSISPRGRMFYSSKWFLNYFRLTPDGRMLWGGRNDLSTGLDLAKSAEILRKQMVMAFPELAGVPVTHSWTGKLGVTFDMMPNIGQHNGIYYAFGYGGHGFHLATYLGREIALIASGQKKDSPFWGIPHQQYFFYRDKPWLLPFAAMYFRFLDAVS